MQVDVHKNSILEKAAHFEDVSSTKIYDERGRLLVVALQHGASVVVVTAEDDDFESFCAQYGIDATKAEEIVT